MDQDLAITTEPSNGATQAAATKPKGIYIPVPDESENVNNVCPICQEKFEMKWLDDAQEFVWMDAKMFNGRAYHASCHLEAFKDGSSQAMRGTPEPVLGKRKAEVNS